MIKSIYPPEKSENYPDFTKVFLGGPIQGASPWHEKLIDKMTRLNVSNKNILFMSPKPLFTYSPIQKRNFYLKEQINWETEHLRKADIIAFWLDKEHRHFPERAYAQTTRFELGEWMTKIAYSNSQTEEMIIGYDEKFSGIEYIKQRFKENFITKSIPFISDFDNFCEEIFVSVI